MNNLDNEIMDVFNSDNEPKEVPVKTDIDGIVAEDKSDDFGGYWDKESKQEEISNPLNQEAVASETNEAVDGLDNETPKAVDEAEFGDKESFNESFEPEVIDKAFEEAASEMADDSSAENIKSSEGNKSDTLETKNDTQSEIAAFVNEFMSKDDEPDEAEQTEEQTEAVEEAEKTETEAVEEAEEAPAEVVEQPKETGETKEVDLVITEPIDNTVESTTETTEAAKKNNKGKILIIVGACAIAILAIILAVTLFGNNRGNVDNPTVTPQPQQTEPVTQGSTADESTMPGSDIEPVNNEGPVGNQTKFMQFIATEAEFGTLTGIHCKKNTENSNMIEYSGMSANKDLEISAYGYKLYADDNIELCFNNMYSVFEDSIGTDSDGNEYKADTVHIIFVAEVKNASGGNVELKIEDIIINGNSVHTSATSTFDSTSIIETLMIADNDDINTNGIKSLDMKASYKYNGKTVNIGNINLYTAANDLINFDKAFNKMVEARTEADNYAIQYELENQLTIQRAQNGGFTDDELTGMYHNIKEKMTDNDGKFIDYLNEYVESNSISDLTSDILKKMWEVETGEKMTYSGNNGVVRTPDTEKTTDVGVETAE